MKFIVRADDFGYTNTHNDGTIKAIEDGVVTAVDLMLDCPGTEDAIERLKAYPWLSVGWHTHFWGRPVVDPSLVPSMVNAEGRFKWRKDVRLQSTAVYEEALLECRAEIEKCIQLLGKAPDTLTPQLNLDLAIDRAKKQVCDEYGIHYNFFSGKYPRTEDMWPADKRYRHLKIHEEVSAGICIGNSYKDIHLFKEQYDPVKFITNIDTNTDQIIFVAWHPGYLDDYVLNESTCTIARPKDVQALCSKEVKDWIIKNHIELINFRDALYGTNEYQNHLRAINSELLYKKEE